MYLKPVAKSAAISWFGYLSSLVLFVAGLNSRVSAYQESAPAVPYSVAASPWTIDQRGNHRAVVQVTAAAVRVLLPWRRKVGDPLTQNIVVVQATSGTVIANRIVSGLSRESATVVSQASAAGEYEIYDLPFYDDPNYNGSYNSGYVTFANTAASSWPTTNNNPHFPALRPVPLALSGASRRKQTPCSLNP